MYIYISIHLFYFFELKQHGMYDKNGVVAGTVSPITKLKIFVESSFQLVS